jgi:hypothetical protein
MPDWGRILQLIPGAAAAAAGDPHAGAMFMQGLEQGRRLRMQEQQQRQQLERQQTLDQSALETQAAQRANWGADNARAQEAAQQQSLRRAIETLTPFLDRAATTAPDLNTAMVEAATASKNVETQFGLEQGALAGQLQGMSVRRQQAVKAAARALLEQGQKTYPQQEGEPDPFDDGSISLRVAPDSVLVPFTESGIIKPSRLRELADLATFIGPAPTGSKATTQSNVSLERQYADALARGDEEAATRILQAASAVAGARRRDQPVSPRSPLSRTDRAAERREQVQTARDRLFYVLLNNGDPAGAVGELEKLGLDRYVETQKAQQRVEADRRSRERSSRASDEFVDPVPSHPVTSTTSTTPAADGALRQEARRQLEQARQTAGDQRPVTDADLDVLLTKPGNAEILRRQMNGNRTTSAPARARSTPSGRTGRADIRQVRSTARAPSSAVMVGKRVTLNDGRRVVVTKLLPSVEGDWQEFEYEVIR